MKAVNTMDVKVEPVAESDSEHPPPLQVFALTSTLHGIAHIFSTERVTVRCCLWLLFFIGSLGFLLYVCVDRVQFYLEFPYVTKVDEIVASAILFPAITICNLNTFRFSKVTRNDLYHAGELLAMLNSRYEIQDVHLVEESVLEALKIKADFQNFKPRPFNMLEFYNRTGHDIRDMLLSCHFRGKPCRPEDFKVGRDLTTSISDRSEGGTTLRLGAHRLMLFCSVSVTTLSKSNRKIVRRFLQRNHEPCHVSEVGKSYGVCCVLCLLYDETSFEAGIKVQVHSQSEPPFIDQLGFGVAPGFQTFVSCQEQRLVFLPPPWGTCKMNSLDSDFFSTYSLSACRIDCETRYLVENCNCRMVHMPGDAPYCSPELYKVCADSALAYLVEKDNEYCMCETPCNTTRYSKELSFVKIPSKASAKYLAKKFSKSEKYIADNILVLDIFFEALNYETIEQRRAYEVAGLLAKYKLCRCSDKKQENNSTDHDTVMGLKDVKCHVGQFH
ncbi:Acid-sensing ion channel 1A [Bagarius yarrelli]|uniref:Acid-sensing ion channel 1A n=1 Tax=Bagarius yarrelli TaxID=175774 RepID=A0A556VCI4_BAGYA|nr:Acid-sensing ion channel 1A [Bagarius yarrelli]